MFPKRLFWLTVPCVLSVSATRKQAPLCFVKPLWKYAVYSWQVSHSWGFCTQPLLACAGSSTRRENLPNLAPCAPAATAAMRLRSHLNFHAMTQFRVVLPLDFPLLLPLGGWWQFQTLLLCLVLRPPRLLHTDSHSLECSDSLWCSPECYKMLGTLCAGFLPAALSENTLVCSVILHVLLKALKSKQFVAKEFLLL